MRLGVARGNKNRAVWRDVTVVDGEVYRLPSGEVVRAKVEPHPDGPPEYWSEAEAGWHRWPVGKGLRLSVLWPAPDEREPASVGPASIRYLTVACAGRVPWSLGYCVREVNGTPDVWREVRDDGEGRRTGWTLADLEVADDEEEFEFRWAAGRASLAWGRLAGMK